MGPPQAWMGGINRLFGPHFGRMALNASPRIRTVFNEKDTPWTFDFHPSIPR